MILVPATNNLRGDSRPNADEISPAIREANGRRIGFDYRRGAAPSQAVHP